MQRWRQDQCESQETAAPRWLAPGSEEAKACGSHFVAAITSARTTNIDEIQMRPWDPPHPTEVYAVQYEEKSQITHLRTCSPERRTLLLAPLRSPGNQLQNLVTGRFARGSTNVDGIAGAETFTTHGDQPGFLEQSKEQH